MVSPKTYRITHHRCRWCKYIRYVQPPHCICGDYYKCLVKDKLISELFWQNRGMFCRVYSPEEIDFDI